MFSVLVSPPEIEPITLAEAKAQCRVTHSAEDDLLESYIVAARQHAEDYTKRSFIKQRWRSSFDSFPLGRIVLPRPALIEVISVGYTDGNGAPQTVASYQTSFHPITPSIRPLYGTEWPVARDDEDVVQVEYWAGFGTTRQSVPAPIRQAIRLLVGHWNQNRSEVEVGTIVSQMKSAAEALLDPWRVRRTA